MLGLALSLKPYAGLIVILFLVGKRYRGALAAVGTWAILALVVSVRFGLGCWREFLAGMPRAHNVWAGSIRNASVQGIALRLWEPSCGPRGPTLWQATLLGAIVSLAVVVALAWLSRRAPAATAEPASDEAIDLPFALFVLASAWLNPVLWEHYDVTLLQPMAIVLFHAWRLRGPRRRAWLMATVAIAVAVAGMIGLDVDEKLRLLETWRAAHQHARLHVYELANWLPWPLLIATAAALAWRRARPVVDE
jgi:hypothetical protein